MDSVMVKRACPLVSVIMPAYNCGKYIEAAIRSVQAQTFTDWELLIIDDCSTEEPCDVVQQIADEDPRVRILQNPENMGVAKTRNRGMDLAEGEYLAFLDSDDVWHPTKLEMQLQRMRETGADICYTSYRIVDADGVPSKPAYLVPEQVDYEALLKQNVMGCSTVMLRWSRLKEYRFRTDFYHEDYVLWRTLLREGHQACGCRETLTDWRLIANSRSFNKVKAAKNRWRIYTDYLHLPLGVRLNAFAGYALAGLRKYR